MATPRNLHALDIFKKGGIGYARGHRVSRATASGTPKGSLLVKALQDLEAGKNGWFEEAAKSE